MALRPKRLRLAALAAVALAGVFLRPAWANHHFMMVREVYAGSPDNPNAQFIELQMYFGGQNVVSGHKVVVYTAAGAPVPGGTFTFGGNVGNGLNQASILVATTQAQAPAGFNISADLTMTPVIPAAGGKACFESSSFGVIDCVSWGNFTGGTAGVGAPVNPTEGIPSGASIERTDARGTPGDLDSADDTHDSAADFAIAEPKPRNNAGTEKQACCRVGFSATLYAVDESAGTATITVTRQGTAASALTVSYSTAAGTATAGADYTETSGTLSFAANESSKTFSVLLASDGTDEGDETVKLRLRNPSVGVLHTANATLRINGTLAAPGAAQSLTATGGTGQIVLGWSPPATGGAPTSYKVYRGTTPGSVNELIATVPAAQTAYTDSGLGGGVTRSYQVSGVNAVGEGPRSNVASATTAAAPPGAPSLAAASGPGAGEIRLTWTAAAPNGSAVVAYSVFRGTTPTTIDDLVVTLGGAVFTYTDSGLGGGTTRYYQVSAENAVGQGPRSNTASAQTYLPPGAPSNLRALPGVLRTMLTWQAPSFTGGLIGGYRVYRSGVDGSGGLLEEIGPVTSYNDTTCNLMMERVCTYRVAAFNPAGESGLTDPATMVGTVP